MSKDMMKTFPEVLQNINFLPAKLMKIMHKKYLRVTDNEALRMDKFKIAREIC